MDNLEKLLDDIRIADVEPDEILVRRTKSECNKMLREERRTEIVNNSRKSRLTVQLLAAAAFVAFIFVALVVSSISNRNPIEGAAYYTIDINPSIGFTVDEENNVIDVTLQNEDAKDLYEGMNVVGLKLQQALSLIIQAAQQKGYLTDAEGKYVLLGQFLKDIPDEEGWEILNQLMASLESEVGDDVRIIGLNGDDKDLQQAEELKVSAGIVILCELVDDVEAGEDVKVGDIVDKLPDEYSGEPEFLAPVIAVTAEDNMLSVIWDPIDFSKVTTEGAEVEYKLLKGTTLDEIKQMENVVVSSVVGLHDEQPLGFRVDIAPDELNEKVYYCLYVHCSNTSKVSNVLPVTAQTSLEETHTDEPTATPEPIDDDEKIEIEAVIDGNYITIEWSKVEENDRFDGYKVMYSTTDSTPVYDEEGCYYLEFVTDINTTSGTYKLSSLNGYEQGKKYYFSITALYDEHAVKIAGDVISRTMPTVTNAPTATPKPTDAPTNEYPSTNIRGERDGDVFYLSWDKISHEDLEGYKVVYSFTDSSPVYGENSYVRWITNASTTSTTVNVSELGEHSEGYVYFSITALYNDHSVKKAGNSVKLTTPGYQSDPYVTPTLTSATYLEEGIKLTWNAVEHDELTYYKANYSFTNSSPAYGASGTTSHMTYDLSKWADVSGLNGYGPGEVCYVSVTAVYSNGKETSSVMTVTIPAETTPTYTAADLTSASYLGDGQFKLTWSTVDDPDFSEYALYYSLNGASYVACAEIVNMTTSSKTVTIAGVEPGATCKFKIATYYNGDYSNGYYGSTVKTVNVPEETTPEPTPETTPEPDPTPTPSLSHAFCSEENGVVYMEWSCSEHADFDYFKVVYQVDGASAKYINVGSATSWSKAAVEMEGFSEGASCTFKVIAVYTNGDSNASGTITDVLTAGSA